MEKLGLLEYCAKHGLRDVEERAKRRVAEEHGEVNGRSRSRSRHLRPRHMDGTRQRRGLQQIKEEPEAFLAFGSFLRKERTFVFKRATGLHNRLVLPAPMGQEMVAVGPPLPIRNDGDYTMSPPETNDEVQSSLVFRPPGDDHKELLRNPPRPRDNSEAAFLGSRIQSLHTDIRGLRTEGQLQFERINQRLDSLQAGIRNVYDKLDSHQYTKGSEKLDRSPSTAGKPKQQAKRRFAEVPFGELVEQKAKNSRVVESAKEKPAEDTGEMELTAREGGTSQGISRLVGNGRIGLGLVRT
ncbi:hypothetical protein HYFRA_00009196 [Hymenoscyphus fraxineus]|uniref:Uncharacterized protein n=1 Tax=Hymenoscyphus fraxineus TaxID=746836 RepID=A0A9N9KY28_9HELO|nr:hypothetical protein HYFRA_00009196 [Hymenoscyphus fraxineus]